MPGFVLHRFGFGADKTLTEYTQFRHDLLRGGDPQNPALSLNDASRKIGRLTLRFAERNTPALFGAGLLDQIQESTLVETAKRQRRDFPRISGRVARTANGAAGRFGWRGQMATLRGFVLAACANELGLEVSGHHQVENPLAKRQRGNKSVPKPMLDLSDDHCEALVAFLDRLPTPQRRSPDELCDPDAVRVGEEVFKRIGCAACHLPSLGPAIGVYSDLLLHDMGPRLADSHSAFPTVVRTSRRVQTGGGYSGGSVTRTRTTRRVVKTNLRQEWRTPPLWGVADSAPYLHDGRAATLRQAIQLHGGEARSAASAFRDLAADKQEQLVAFLLSLVAPPNAAGDKGVASGD